MVIDKLYAMIEERVSILPIAILFLSALVFTFVFIINGDDWFPDVKLAGPLAGLFLATRTVMAIILVYLVMQYPDRWNAVLAASIGYCGSFSSTQRFRTGLPRGRDLSPSCSLCWFSSRSSCSSKNSVQPIQKKPIKTPGGENPLCSPKKKGQPARLPKASCCQARTAIPATTLIIPPAD